jgi:hypothetical protein
MSLSQVTNRDRAALPPWSVASLKPLEVLQDVLPAWEHTNSFLAGSVRQLKSVDQTLNAFTSTVSELPNNVIRASLVEHLTALQQVVDDQLEAREKEAEMSELCLRAFNQKRAAPLARADSKYLRLFVQVLNSAPKDMTIGELQRSFAKNFASVKAHRGAAGPQEQRYVASREAVSKSSLGDSGVKVQSHRPNKTKHAASTSEQPLRDTTNLKPTPKTHANANANSKKQDRAHVPSIFAPKSNKIRLVTSKSLPSKEKVPTSVMTQPRRVGIESESVFGDAHKGNHDHAIEEKPTVVTASEVHRVQYTTHEAGMQHLCLESDVHSVEKYKHLNSNLSVVTAEPEGHINSKEWNTSSNSPMSKSSPARGESESKSIETTTNTPKPEDGTSVVEDNNAEGASSKESKNGRTTNTNEPRIDRRTVPIVSLEEEGIDLENVVHTRRRDNAGGGSAPRNHTRQPEYQGGNKRKRLEHDDGPWPLKKPAIEGRYIARPKVCYSSVALLFSFLTWYRLVILHLYQPST